MHKKPVVKKPQTSHGIGGRRTGKDLYSYRKSKLRDYIWSGVDPTRRPHNNKTTVVAK